MVMMASSSAVTRMRVATLMVRVMRSCSAMMAAARPLSTCSGRAPCVRFRCSLGV